MAHVNAREPHVGSWFSSSRMCLMSGCTFEGKGLYVWKHFSCPRLAICIFFLIFYLFHPDLNCIFSHCYHSNFQTLPKLKAYSIAYGSLYILLGMKICSVVYNIPSFILSSLSTPIYSCMCYVFG